MKKMLFRCPSCSVEHTVEVRNLARGMCETLIKICKIQQKDPNSWVDLKAHSLSENDCEKLVLWNLAQTAPPSGRKKKSGLWVATQQGYNFASGALEIPKAVNLIQSQIIGYDDAMVSVKKMVPPESYDALWAG
jgi:hypothetical protein